MYKTFGKNFDKIWQSVNDFCQIRFKNTV